MTQSVCCEITKSKKSRPRKISNRDHYHRCQMSMLAIEEIETRIQQWLNPFDWKPMKMFVRKEKLPIGGVKLWDGYLISNNPEFQG